MKKNKNKQDEEQAIDLFRSILEGVRHLHSRNIIHRDIKAENIMLSNSIAKIGDLGCCVTFEANDHGFCGTPEYMSPEVHLGKNYDHRTDLWSLGVLLFEILVG